MPDVVSPATDNIEEYIKIISKLLEDGYAYEAGGNVYFDVSKLEDYYKLTNHKEDDMVVGVREGVDFDDNKRNQADFALWFTKSKFEDQDLKWDSPFGVGYPGWHIECTGISLKYLGEHLDIHGGGVDNIFPHHTNEIAQSEAYLGHKWCNYWFHKVEGNTGDKFFNQIDIPNGFTFRRNYNTALKELIPNSSGRNMTDENIDEALKENGYNPLAFRFMCLQSHYRKQLVFSYPVLEQVQNQYNKLINKISLIKEEGSLQEDKVKEYQDRFKEELSNDLNTANSITVLYDLIKDDTINGTTKIYLIKDFDKVLSLDLIKEKDSIDSELEKYIQDKIEERKIAKQNKDYALSDAIRDELLSKGIELIDTREGTTYKIK